MAISSGSFSKGFNSQQLYDLWSKQQSQVQKQELQRMFNQRGITSITPMSVSLTPSVSFRKVTISTSGTKSLYDELSQLQQLSVKSKEEYKFDQEVERVFKDLKKYVQGKPKSIALERFERQLA